MDHLWFFKTMMTTESFSLNHHSTCVKYRFNYTSMNSVRSRQDNKNQTNKKKTEQECLYNIVSKATALKSRDRFHV